MYEQHYGLAEKPFEIAPDPRFLFLNPSYRELLAALLYGVTERKGVIVLVGEVGTGKTLMINSLKQRLDSNVGVATIVNPDLTFRQMLSMILVDLGIDDGKLLCPTAVGLQRLKRYSEERRENAGNVLIVVDEAQNLRNKTLESLRMLSNIETSSTKLIQLIFSGQPELERKLQKPEWRQFVQRISIKRRSAQLTQVECGEYIRHRLSVAGRTGPSPFSREAQQAVFEYSEGIPRKINILCDNALLIGYGLNRKTVDAAIIDEAVADLDWVRPSTGGATAAPRPQRRAPQGKMTHGGVGTSFLKKRLPDVPPLAVVLTGFLLLIGLTLWGWSKAGSG